MRRIRHTGGHSRTDHHAWHDTYSGRCDAKGRIESVRRLSAERRQTAGRPRILGLCQHDAPARCERFSAERTLSVPGSHVMTTLGARGPERVPALIVGAGGAGLSLSLLLLQQGIQPLLIERRPDISVYPRARNLNFRTFEVFRGLGLEAAIRAAGAKLSQVVVKATLSSSP